MCEELRTALGLDEERGPTAVPRGSPSHGGHSQQEQLASSQSLPTGVSHHVSCEGMSDATRVLVSDVSSSDLQPGSVLGAHRCWWR